MEEPYVPERGDVVFISFNPQLGHEQAGIRPAVVLSPRSYNAKVRLGIFCPITSHIKGYPFEVVLPESIPVTGAVLCDQLKSMDWTARALRFVSTLPLSTVDEIMSRVRALLDD